MWLNSFIHYFRVSLLSLYRRDQSSMSTDEDILAIAKPVLSEPPSLAVPIPIAVLPLKTLNKQASATETKILTTTKTLLLFELGVIETERPVISVKEVLDCEYVSVLVVDTH